MKAVGSYRAERGAAVGALLAYSGVVVALTMLKQFFRIGSLWDPANQPFTGFNLIPFYELFHADSWFSPVFDYGGNLALFVPVGLLVYVIFGRVRTATLFGGAFSLLIEITQLVFGLGYTDIDDFLMNTLGAFIGAMIAEWCGPKWNRVWAGLTFAAVAGFVCLVPVSGM